jgi:hypothetical protein
MSILDKKNKIMADISALNVLTEGMPKLKKSNSFPSINNGENTTNFLLDLVEAVGAYDELIDNISDFLTRKLPEVESAIKKDLKRELKSIVSCSVNPSVPAWFRSTGSGVVLKLSDVDFFGITKTDPKGPYGPLIYDDANAGLNSTDYNTFLYSNIELNKSDYTPNGGLTSTWGTSTTQNDILDIRFSPVGTTENNIIKFNTNSSYDNKSLYEFNNDFIDSISLFGSVGKLSSDKLLNVVIDSLFGTISSKTNKSKKQLEDEEKLKKVIDCILNSDDGNISDNFFTFTNEELIKINEKANNRKKGVGVVETFDTQEVTVPIETLKQVNNDFIGSTSNPTSIVPPMQAQYDSIKNSINLMSNKVSENIPVIDKPSIKNNFILNLVNEIARAIVSVILSPKLISVYAINYQILYGQNEKYDGPIDFVKKNKNLIRSLGKTVLEAIIKMLLTLVLKYISIKLSKKFSEDEIEKGKNYTSQILSLLGVPPMIIRQIQGISYIGT